MYSVCKACLNISGFDVLPATSACRAVGVLRAAHGDEQVITRRCCTGS